MKPIPKDDNGRRLQLYTTELETIRVESVDATVGTILVLPEMKSLLIWSDNAAAFTVAGLSNGIKTTTVTHPTVAIQAAAATDEGGGKVGIPFNGTNTVAVGESAIIAGTTNYNGTYVALTGTTVNKLVITDTYVAEVFAGTETARRVRSASNDEVRCPGSLQLTHATDSAMTLVVKSVSDTVNINAIPFR